MIIRHSEEKDFERMMEIYEYARGFMAETGNPNQWGPTNWPPEGLIRDDIKQGHSYVCEEDGHVVGTFYFIYGKDIEETYVDITDGEWSSDEAYGVVHRLASDRSVKGIGTCCLEWAFEQCGHIRIDTHTDNAVMQNLLEKLGYTKRGIIYVVEDNYPRFAYDKRAVLHAEKAAEEVLKNKETILS